MGLIGRRCFKCGNLFIGLTDFGFDDDTKSVYMCIGCQKGIVREWLRKRI